MNLVTAYPLAGGGRFRYHERLRPQPSFATIVKKLLAADADFRVQHISETLRIITREGEYGAWVRIAGRRASASAMRYIGAVFVDEFATALDVIALVPGQFAELERLSLDLLKGQSFGMTQRPRPFFYVPPLGWQGIPAGVVTNWYPPDFPMNLTNIVVPPASLSSAAEAELIDAALAQLGAGLQVDSTEREHLVAAAGHRGTFLRLTGQRAGLPLHRDLAFFVVPPYTYQMRLETAMAPRLLELREVFRTVASSFHPLPSGDEKKLGSAFARVETMFDHWTS